MKKKTAGAATVAIAVANADVVTANARDLKRKGKKSGKESKTYIPDPLDLRYGALCVDNEDIDGDRRLGPKSTKSPKSAKKGKSKGKPLYYDGEESCVTAKELDVTECADHKVIVYEEGCAVRDTETDGCKTKEMCAQRHQSGETCTNCADPDKIHGCVGCPFSGKKKRGLMADAW